MTNKRYMCGAPEAWDPRNLYFKRQHTGELEPTKPYQGYARQYWPWVMAGLAMILLIWRL